MEIYTTGIIITFFIVLWATEGRIGTAFFSALLWPLAILAPLVGLFFGLKKDK